MTIFARTVACYVVFLSLGMNIASAAPPWARLLPFKKVKVEADSKKSYPLTEGQGPWLILATSFNGPEGELQARELILDLRRNHQMKAYLHSQHYDFTKPVVGRGYDKYGEPLKMKHVNAQSFENYAVLIGDFESFDSDDAQRTLEKIKYLAPQSLGGAKKKDTASISQLRYWQRKLSKNLKKKQKGFMGGAFITRNPLLPKEFFVPKGLNPLVVRMNKGVKYGLLDCKQKYTIQVATFRGLESINPSDVQGKRVSRQLEEAAIKAHKLTTALRKQGVEAYEFHDLHESIVTIGGFDSVGSPRRDGKIEINPAVHEIMKRYSAGRRQFKGLRGKDGQRVGGAGDLSLIPKQMGGISFDIQAVPVEVPRQTIAATYGQRRLFHF